MEITQESAAELLFLDIKTLSNYENEKCPVPNDVVARMAKVYGIPSLPFHHVKYYTELGEFFPDYIEPDGFGDMGFQSVISRDELIDTVDKFTSIIKDCKKEIPPEKEDAYTECMDCFKSVGGKIMSIEAYGRQQICGLKNKAEII